MLVRDIGKTNCLTHIPEDIKLELNNGTLTLKAGSKVYVPNGVGVFDVVVIESDIVVGVSSNTDGSWMLFYRTDEMAYANVGVISCVSGTTTPTTGYVMFYNTSNNTVRYVNNGSVSSVKWSLPLAKISKQNNVISIDQVFNGFGYIGNTYYMLPNVKFLCSEGFNSDGSYKNTEYVVNSVITKTTTYNVPNAVLFFASGKIELGIASAVYEVENTLPTPASSYERVYVRSENQWYYHAASGTSWLKLTGMCVLGKGELVNPQGVTYLTPNPVQTKRDYKPYILTRGDKRYLFARSKRNYYKESTKEQATGTYTFTLDKEYNAKLLFVGNGGGGASSQKSSVWYYTGGGSGACFEGKVNLPADTYTLTVGTLGYSYNIDNVAGHSNGVQSTDSFLTNSAGEELIRVGAGKMGTGTGSGGAGGTLTLGTIEVLETIKAVNGNQGGEGSSSANHALSAYDGTTTGYGAGTGSERYQGNVYGIAGIFDLTLITDVNDDYDFWEYEFLKFY